MEQSAAWFPVVVADLVFILYFAGIVGLWCSGRKWSVPRTFSFFLGCLLLLTVTGIGIGTYGGALFSVFMFQRLTLLIVVLPPVTIGSPDRLFLQATPHDGVGLVLLRALFAVFCSQAARAIIHPAFFSEPLTSGSRLNGCARSNNGSRTSA